MQHIVEIAFNFDDDSITRACKETVEKEMDTIIKNLVLDEIAPKKNVSYNWSEKARDWIHIEHLVIEKINDTIDEHKKEIIDVAANRLVEHVKRTKIWKETIGEVINEPV